MTRWPRRQRPLRPTPFSRGDAVEILQGKLAGEIATVTRCHLDSVTVMNPRPSPEAGNTRVTLPLHAVRGVSPS